MITSMVKYDASDIRNIEAKLENRTKRILRLETVLRDSGKGDTEIIAELAKVKAENRSLKVFRHTTRLTYRASIMRFCPSREQEVFGSERIGVLHPLALEVFLPIQVLLRRLPPRVQTLRQRMQHPHKRHQALPLKSAGSYDSKNWKHA
jgi:hypothetical protein